MTLIKCNFWVKEITNQSRYDFEKNSKSELFLMVSWLKNILQNVWEFQCKHDKIFKYSGHFELSLKFQTDQKANA